MDERDRMEHRRPMWIPWAITSVMLVLVAVTAYNIGVSREAVAAGQETGRRIYWGFPGFWGFIVLIWIFGGLRWMWWGPRYCRPWRYGRYYHPYYDDRDEFEEWHRREHDRMDGRRDARRDSPSSSPDRGPIT